MIDIFIPLLLGLLLAYLLVIWPTLFVGHTASKPKLEYTSSNTVNYACFAATDQVKNDSLYEQRVSYRITAPQLDSICNNEIKSISIHMGKMGYKSKMRKGVSEDLQIRYNMLMDYLLENSSE